MVNDQIPLSRYDLERLLVYVTELERLLDDTADQGLNQSLMDSDTYIGQVWRGLPALREYAQERLDRLAEDQRDMEESNRG